MDRLRKALLTATLMLASGCASQAWDYETRLDPASGLTIGKLPRPITMAKATPQFSQAARDYLYLGPVQVNRMGAKEHHLWLGFATTVDRMPFGDTPPRPTRLVVVADDLAMDLVLQEWDPARNGEVPYEVANTPYLSLASRVTPEQLTVIGRAEQVRVYVVTADSQAVEYERWNGFFDRWLHSSIAAFAR